MLFSDDAKKKYPIVKTEQKKLYHCDTLEDFFINTKIKFHEKIFSLYIFWFRQWFWHKDQILHLQKNPIAITNADSTATGTVLNNALSF